MQQPELSPPSIHFGDAVRAAVPLLVAYGLTKLAFSEHYQLDAVGWIVFAVLEAALVFSGVRIAMLEARPPRDRQTVLTRTREIGPIKELVIAGMGGFLLWAALAAVLMCFCTEIWAGHASASKISAPEVVMALVMFGLPGFFMMYWRPMFAIDLARGAVRRFRFGRALGTGKLLAGSGLRVVSEGYFVTNTGIRLGDMVRGKVNKYTFELELIRGNLGEAYVARRVAWWAQALHGTPEAAGEAHDL